MPEAEQVAQEGARIRQDALDFSKASTQSEKSSVEAELHYNAEVDYNQVLRRDIEDIQVQSDLIERDVTSEVQKIAAQTGDIYDISEDEIRSFAGRLNEMESAQVYERLKNEDLHFVETVNDADADETIVTVDSLQPIEIIDDSIRPADVDDESTEDIEVFAGMQPDSQDQDEEAYPESLTISSDFEDLISEIESSFETTEQEILGELLIAMFTEDLNETSAEDETVLFSASEAEEIKPSVDQSETDLNPLEKFTVLVENYEPEVKARAVELISTITEVINQLKSDAELSDQDKGLLIDELEQTIHALFATLGLNLEEEQAHKFVELLLLSFSYEREASVDYDIDYLNRMGTKEYKRLNGSPLLSGLVQPASGGLKYIDLIGKYTLQVCVA